MYFDTGVQKNSSGAPKGYRGADYLVDLSEVEFVQVQVHKFCLLKKTGAFPIAAKLFALSRYEVISGRLGFPIIYPQIVLTPRKDWYSRLIVTTTCGGTFVDYLGNMK
jgi:hypothetical protein